MQMVYDYTPFIYLDSNEKKACHRTTNKGDETMETPKTYDRPMNTYHSLITTCRLSIVAFNSSSVMLLSSNYDERRLRNFVIVSARFNHTLTFFLEVVISSL